MRFALALGKRRETPIAMESQKRLFPDFFRRETLGGLVQVNQCASLLGGYHLERGLEGLMAVAAGGAENVAQQAVRVHADQDGLGRIADIAANQGHVGSATVHFTLVGDEAEFPMLGFDHRLAYTMYVALMLHAVAD